MIEVNKAELRRLAEAANRTGMEWPGASEFANQLPSEADYCEFATPAAVLSLLDENEQLRAEVEALRVALGDCIDSLHGEMLQKFGGQLPEDMHPVTRKDYDRDQAELAEYRAVLAKEGSAK